MSVNPGGKLSRTQRGAAGFDRRRFLRGLGACVALPAFESVLPSILRAGEVAASESAGAAAGAAAAPVRMAFVYIPNGVNQANWWPTGEGADFQFGATMQPLEKLKEHVQVLGGLDHLNATPGPDGPGDHARANGTFLTGVRVRKT